MCPEELTLNDYHIDTLEERDDYVLVQIQVDYMPKTYCHTCGIELSGYYEHDGKEYCRADFDKIPGEEK
jgi:hypothetical protein